MVYTKIGKKLQRSTKCKESNSKLPFFQPNLIPRCPNECSTKQKESKNI
jgi:hypothetical protein